MPSPSTNQGPVDDLGSAATTDGDPRSKIIKNWPEQPAANYRCLACPAPGGTSPPIPGCPAPSRKENPALRNFTSADAPEQPALHVPNQPDSHRPRRTERRLRALCPGKGQLQSVRSRRLPTAWCVCASMAYGVRRRVRDRRRRAPVLCRILARRPDLRIQARRSYLAVSCTGTGSGCSFGWCSGHRAMLLRDADVQFRVHVQVPARYRGPDPYPRPLATTAARNLIPIWP